MSLVKRAPKKGVRVSVQRGTVRQSVVLASKMELSAEANAGAT